MTKISEKFIFHGEEVSAIKGFAGKHRSLCLCHSCALFHPEDREKNCPIANAVYSLDRLADVTTPVLYCKIYEGI